MAMNRGHLPWRLIARAAGVRCASAGSGLVGDMTKRSGPGLIPEAAFNFAAQRRCRRDGIGFYCLTVAGKETNAPTLIFGAEHLSAGGVRIATEVVYACSFANRYLYQLEPRRIPAVGGDFGRLDYGLWALFLDLHPGRRILESRDHPNTRSALRATASFVCRGPLHEVGDQGICAEQNEYLTEIALSATFEPSLAGVGWHSAVGRSRWVVIFYSRC